MNAITPLVLVSEQNSFGVRFRTSRFSEGNRGFKMMYTTRVRYVPTIGVNYELCIFHSFQILTYFPFFRLRVRENLLQLNLDMTSTL